MSTLNYITVTGTYLDPDKLTPKIGYVEFRPNVPLALSDGGILYSEPLRADLDANGFFTIDLLACDNVDVFPYGWYWFVDEKIENGNQWYLMAYTPAGGGRNPLDISNAYRPVGVSDQPPTVVQPGPAGVKGDQGTVSVDSTITGEPGSEAVVIDLDPLNTNAKLQFIIPRGEKGLKGDSGEVTGVGLPEVYAEPNVPALDLTDAILWVDIDDVGGTSGSGGTVAEIYIEEEPPGLTGNNILWVDKNDTTTETPANHLTPDEVLAGSNVTISRTATTVTINSTASGSGGDFLTPDEILAGSNVTISRTPTTVTINSTATGGGGGSNAPGLIYLDDMVGASDDAKLDAAIALAQSYSTIKPAIAFGARRYDFTTANRPVYSGLKLIGLAGQGSQQRGANSIPNDIRFNGTGIWWQVPAGQTFDVHMSGLSFQGNNNAQFMASNPGVLWTSVFGDLGFNLWKHVFGNPSDITNTKFLNTACKWLGYFNFNNGYSTAVTFGGSDSDFFLDGALIDSPPSLTPAPMPAGDYHIIFDYQEKSGVGPIYNTADRCSGIKITGGATTTGLVLYGMGRCEGRNIGAPCYGSNIRINGGGVTLRDWWVAYGGTAFNTNGHSGEGGIITQTGGDVLYDGLWYDRATGVAESVPFIYVSGGKARVRNIRTGTKGGSWTGKPVITTAGSGTVVADDSVTATTATTASDTVTIVNGNRLANGLRINRTDPAQSASDKDIFVIYNGTGTADTDRGTWVNEKGQLRTSNQTAKTEVAFKVIGASQAESGSGNMFEILDIAGNIQVRVGILGRLNALKGMRLQGDTLEIQDSTSADTSTISQPLSGDLVIAPKRNMSVSSKKVVSLADGTANSDAVNLGQLNARTPLIVKSTTAPTDLTAIWIDTN